MANRPGRPALAHNDPSVGLHLVLPGRAFDALCRRAHAERLTVAELIRRTLREAENKKTETPAR